MSPTEGRRGYPVIAALVVASMVLVTVYYKEGQEGPLHRVQGWSIGLIAPAQSAIARVAQPISEIYGFFVDVGKFRTENAALKRQNTELRSKLRSMSALEAENKRLRSLLVFKQRTEFKGLPAKVIGWQSTSWQSTIIIDLGSNDGVQKGMPVVTGDGLVGQVIQTSANASRILLIIDQKSGVSVQLGGSGDVGVLQGQSDGSLLVSYISKETTVSAGEAVVTSGLGGVFPKGLFVGKTAEPGKVGYNLYKAVKVISPVDFRRLEEVLVVTNPPEKTPFGE
ncbi:MAG: rod shape-determining protein MreC [Actinobacteria bacterium]|nr:rod shape-determining protein MreC [Actinomycetota bacterium]